MKLAAIVVAAGRGTRMGTAIPKAFLSLDGVPVLIHSLRTVGQLANLRRWVVVASNDHLPTAAKAIEAANLKGPQIELVAGGRERQDSVANGLAAITSEAELVLVHDAARPFVSLECMQRCVAAASASGAAIVAEPARDSVKLCDDGVVRETVDRRRVWLAQTPQVFRADWLRQAYDRADREFLLVTDDAALVERCGFPVQVIEGEASNRKLTTPEDWHWAEWFVDQRKL